MRADVKSRNEVFRQQTAAMNVSVCYLLLGSWGVGMVYDDVAVVVTSLAVAWQVLEFLILKVTNALS